MKHFKQTIAVIVFTFVASIIVFNGCKKKEELEVNIAVNLPLTGDLSTYGEAVNNGVSLAMENLKNKIKPGEPILNFDWQDNASQAKNAVNIMQKQFLKKVDIYISGVKPQTMSIIDEIQKRQVPHFVWVFDAFVTKNYKNTLRTWVSYKYEPELYLRYIELKRPKKIAIIYVNFPHAEEEFNKLVIPKLSNLGVEKTLTEIYDWNKKDYKDIATKVKTFGPDLIIFNGFKATIIGLVKSFKESNLIKEGNVICTYDMLDAAEELAPNVIEGIRVITPKFNTRHSDNTENWKQEFEKRFSRKPRYTDAYAYDMTNIIYDAAKRIGKNPNGTEMYNAILSTKLAGITGELIFDSDGDLKIDLEIGVYRNGKLIPDVERKE